MKDTPLGAKTPPGAEFEKVAVRLPPPAAPLKRPVPPVMRYAPSKLPAGGGGTGPLLALQARNVEEDDTSIGCGNHPCAGGESTDSARTVRTENRAQGGAHIV